MIPMDGIKVLDAILDGTSRARDFPSAWQVTAQTSPNGNMEMQWVTAPTIFVMCGGGASNDAISCNGFKMPVMVNNRDLVKGDVLTVVGEAKKPATLLTNQLQFAKSGAASTSDPAASAAAAATMAAMAAAAGAKPLPLPIGDGAGQATK